ncbi:hypothetical protein IWW36_003298 [Coemansia brasiliensis]|uniref:SPT2-domain-containing protein n=1 Tax=Coemansia brasiliensis TaxID=2650707 RepID=A0A9W8I820_9FUNG|nr:hypothetical protein IWW36_003298 [Coemansia brasiliensis]
MGTEFEKLMRIAEQNTLDIQRISLEKKRQHANTATQASNRELIEKRRKVELERRIQQRDHEEKQREARMEAARERRRRERLEAEQQAAKAKALAARKRPAASKPERSAASAARAGGQQRVGKQLTPRKDTVRSEMAASRVSKTATCRASAIPQQRARKPSPEREIDRFGVRSSSTLRSRPSSSAAAISRSRAADRPINNSHVRQQQQRQQIVQRTAPASSRPRSSTAKRHYDQKADESEYDSMDDFIVDDEDEGEYRVGSIRKMFGVRYHDVNDEDDDDMEVSATQLMREDLRSARIGRLEDEEEERKLAEEERRRQQRQRMREAR